jgi:hypothetical protein
MANLYNISTLLEGKFYRSRSRNLEGIIQYAEKRDGVYFDNAEAYLITVRPTYEMGKLFRGDFYATVAVKVGE